MDAGGAMDSDQRDGAGRGGRPFFLLVGGYLVLLGAWRASQVFPLLPDTGVEGYPNWLVPYLAVIVALVLAAGVGLVLAGALPDRRARAARLAGLAGAGCLTAFAGLHTWFLIAHEHSYADGGFVWGFFHILTLTRLPTTATESGIAGYQIGQVVGMVVWFVVCLVAVGMSVLLLELRGLAAAQPAPSPISTATARS